jgi:adenosylhomocysteine nucleosidase
MKLLFVAAARMEYTGILSHLQSPHGVDLDLDWAHSGRLAEHEVLLVANGAGSACAAKATDKGFLCRRPDAIISTGFCGALEPNLDIGEIICATRVNGYSAHTVKGSTAARQGIVRCLDHIAQSSTEKAALRAAGACAVEMEALGVAERAELWGVPFYCVRAVTDLAGENLANDLNSALRSDGHFDTIQVLTGALRQPAVRIPELLRLRRRAVQAARSLGDFFADCRF